MQKNTDFDKKSVFSALAGDRNIEYLKQELPLLFSMSIRYFR